jgi:hypothetical protein
MEDHVMSKDQQDPQPLRDPLAEIERALLRAYVAGAGHDLNDVLTRHDDEARRLLSDASRYASARLSEVEARSVYLHRLHGDS